MAALDSHNIELGGVVLISDLIVPSKELDVVKTKMTPRLPNTINPVL